MPLLDHFRKPLETRAPWCSVGSMWVSKLVEQINAMLPGDRYFAIGSVRLGSESEADIGEFELPATNPIEWDQMGLQPVPEAIATVEPIFPDTDEYSVLVRETRDEMNLVGAIEFVSPANKDREETRIQFIQKCISYLKLGVGIVIVDIVTTRHANLHNDLMQELQAGEQTMLIDTPLYVSGYQPVMVNSPSQLKIWPFPVLLNHTIPSVPLALKRGPVVMLPLEETYQATLKGHNLPKPPGA